MDSMVLQQLIQAVDINKAIEDLKTILLQSQRTSSPQRVKCLYYGWKVMYVDGVGYLVPHVDIEFT